MADTSSSSESAARDAFANDDEIKILERRLQLLREGLKPLGGAEEGLRKEAKEPGESVEGIGKGELPGAPQAQTAVAPPPQDPPAPQQYHQAKMSELKSYESDRQLKALVEIAFERNLFDAVDIARRLDDAYLLDAFHDVLIDDNKLHKTLIEQGKLTEV